MRIRKKNKMTTTQQAHDFFRKESLYDIVGTARTAAHRFIIRAKNIATNEFKLFIVDYKEQTITDIKRK